MVSSGASLRKKAASGGLCRGKPNARSRGASLRAYPALVLRIIVPSVPVPVHVPYAIRRLLVFGNVKRFAVNVYDPPSDPVIRLPPRRTANSALPR